jgi:hypothetical protein
VAVGTEKDAFRRLGPDGIDRTRDATHRDPKLLRGRISVVELERVKTAAVTAEHALTAGLLNEDLFDPAAPPSNGF